MAGQADRLRLLRQDERQGVRERAWTVPFGAKSEARLRRTNSKSQGLNVLNLRSLLSERGGLGFRSWMLQTAAFVASGQSGLVSLGRGRRRRWGKAVDFGLVFSASAFCPASAPGAAACGKWRAYPGNPGTPAAASGNLRRLPARGPARAVSRPSVSRSRTRCCGEGSSCSAWRYVWIGEEGLPCAA